MDTPAELNEMIDQWDEQDDARRIRSRPCTIGKYFATEQPLLAPLREEAFATGRLSTPRGDGYSQICVRINRCSVPVRLIGRTVASCSTPLSSWSTTAARKSPGTKGSLLAMGPARTRPLPGSPDPQARGLARCHGP
ncbi:hypothetical protein ACIF83_44410 [Streptomyces sp. NPDC085866]|uniref:hypothetical protein n=1 Tax=Streptomyces sp. NPDC085866 TaxID=3365736 RepID=UPI0037CD9955